MISRRVVPQLTRSLTRAYSSSSSPPTPTSTPNKVSTSSPAPPPAQAPNYLTTWSTSQRARPVGKSGPRFEQTAMDLQPSPLSAMELISNEPIRLVDGRKAVCDGGGGPLGHPKVYINLDAPGPWACGYCGLQFEQTHH